MKILLIGYGNIGQKIFHEDIEPFIKDNEINIYDTNPKYNKINYFINPSQIKKQHFNIIYITVPTNTINHKCDTSIVEEVLKQYSSFTDVILLKSTVPVGFTEKMNKIYHNIIFSPEFKSTTQFGSKENFLILGGNKKLSKTIAKFYKKIKPADFKIRYTDSTTAEMVKYMENCFLAMKVTFCNEFADHCNKIGIDYDELRDLFLLDERINPSHTIVFSEQPYYNSHCFNKDIPAFNEQFHGKLMECVEKINKEKKSIIKE